MSKDIPPPFCSSLVLKMCLNPRDNFFAFSWDNHVSVMMAIFMSCSKRVCCRSSVLLDRLLALDKYSLSYFSSKAELFCIPSILYSEK